MKKTVSLITQSNLYENSFNASLSSSSNLMSSVQTRLTSASSVSPVLKLSFYHKNYLLAFKLSIPSKIITSSTTNYKQLEKKFNQILSEQLIFSTPEESSLIQKINLNYLETFIQILNQEKRTRIEKDFMGNNTSENLLTFGSKWETEAGNQQANGQAKNPIQQFQILLSRQQIDEQNLAQKVNQFLYEQKTSNPQFLKQSVSNSFLKEILLVLKFVERTFLQNKSILQSNQIQSFFLYFIIVLKYYYSYIPLISKFPRHTHNYFISVFIMIEGLIKIIQKLMMDIKIEEKSLILMSIMIQLNQKFIQTTLFIWTTFQRYSFTFQEQENSSKQSQDLQDVSANFCVYKSSILTKLIQFIILTIEMKRSLQSFQIQLNRKQTKKQSIIMWLLDQPIQSHQNSQPKQSLFAKSLNNLSKINSKNSFFSNASLFFKQFSQHSILENLINEISQGKKKKYKKEIDKNKSKKNAFVFQNFTIQSNLHSIACLCKLSKLILQKYIQNIQSSSKDRKTNQLLLFVTEMIRFQLPQQVKKSQDSIKQRRHKIVDSYIITQILSYFKGTLSSSIQQNFITQLSNIEHHLLQGSSLNKISQIPYFRVKQLINIQKPTQDQFFKICKSLLKDLRYLSKQFHQFKAGKIVMQRKIINQNDPQDTMWKSNFIKKKKQLKGQLDNTKNFYEVYYFNYDKFEKENKHCVDVGINVDLVNLSEKRKLSLQQTEIKEQIQRQKQKQHEDLAWQFLQKEHFLENQGNSSKKHNAMTLSIPEQRRRIRRLSESIQKSHQLLNVDNQMIKTKDDKIYNLFKQNQQLIKVNSWYEEQLRVHEDKHEKLEAMISQLISFNKVKQQRLQKKRKQLQFCNEVMTQKIQGSKNFDRKFSFTHFDDQISHHSGQSHSNRLSRDSNGTRSRKKSSAHIRLINDLNKLSSPSVEKISGDFILPPPPPPPQSLASSNEQNKSILPPPPPPMQISNPPNLTLPTPPSLTIPLISPPFNLPIPPSLSLQKIDEKQQNQDLKQPKKQMKTIGWTMIDVTAIPDSFWENVDQIQFNQEDLIVNFSKTPQTIIPTIIATKEKQMQKKSLLKPDRVKNVQIGLRKTKLRYQNMNNLEQILYRYNENYFDEDVINCLISLLPNSKQKQQFSQIYIKEQQKHEWTLPDYFMARLTKIQSFEERIKAVHFKNQFQFICEELIVKIRTFIEFFTQLKNDQFLQVFLSHLLSVGNFLNAKSNKANAYGFRLQSIPKSYTLIGQDHQTSLFEYILKTIWQKNEQIFVPCAQNIFTQVNSPKPLISLNIIEDDFKFLVKQCQNLQEIIIYSKRQEDNSSNYLLPFYIQTQEQISILKKIIFQAKSTFEQVSQFYCQKMNSEEMINFMRQFRKRVKQFVKVNTKKKIGNQQSRLSWAGSQRFSTNIMFN